MNRLRPNCFEGMLAASRCFRVSVDAGDRAYLISGRRRTARHDEIAGEDLYDFTVVVEGGGAHPDQAAVAARLGRAHFEDFALGMQFVAGPHWPRPAQFIEADAQNAAGWLEFAVDHEPHGERCGM